MTERLYGLTLLTSTRARCVSQRCGDVRYLKWVLKESVTTVWPR